MTFNLLFKIRACPLCLNQELHVISTPYHQQSKKDVPKVLKLLVSIKLAEQVLLAWGSLTDLVSTKGKG